MLASGATLTGAGGDSGVAVGHPTPYRCLGKNSDSAFICLFQVPEGKGGFVPIFQMRKTEAQKRQGFVLSSLGLVKEKAKAQEQPRGH